MNRIRLVVNLAVLAGVTAAAQRLERVNPSGLSRAQAFTHVVKAGKMVFIAGQVGAGGDGKIAGPGMKEQTEPGEHAHSDRAVGIPGIQNRDRSHCHHLSRK